MTRGHFRITLAASLLLTMMIVTVLAGCGASASSSGSNSPQTTCANSTALICTRSVQINGNTKQALVTHDGKTLYYFAPDTAASVACTGSCVTIWPPLLSSSATADAIAGLTGTLATVTRSEGTQITYNGHPLYNYSGDAAPGDTKGDGFNGKWYVATVDLAPSGSPYDSGY